ERQEVATMNPIPTPGNVPSTSLTVDGALELMLFIAIVSVCVIFVMMLWTLFDVSRLGPAVSLPRATSVPARPHSAPVGMDAGRASRQVRLPVDDRSRPLRHDSAA